MNHLLHQITWHQYLATALIIAIIYYVVLVLRRYQPELEKIRQRFSSKQNGDALQALQYQAPETEIAAPATQAVTILENNPQESINESDILAGKLKVCIAKAADKPFAPAVLTPQLKTILQQHTDFAATERPSINHLVVNECEKTGTALLTEEEVDQWWER
jgi:hypothetical protein